jgi:ABC-type antimicrobial peptide transport system permease subunit
MPRMLVLFGLIALFLTVAGVYAVFAHSVARRTHELGVRMTLGATRAAILRLVLGRAAVLIGIGTSVGLAMASILARSLGTFLFGLPAFDLGIFAAATIVVSAAATAASFVPARRATRVDPLIALRQD